MRQRTATLPPHCHYLANFCALLNPRAKFLLPQSRLLLLSLTSVSKWPSHRPYNDELYQVQQVQQIKQEVDNSTHYSLSSPDRISRSFWMTKPNTSPHLITNLFTSHSWIIPQGTLISQLQLDLPISTTNNPQKKKILQHKNVDEIAWA